MDAPNIFRYATSELSQDAFVCWLVSCGRLRDGPLAETGLGFVKALMQAGGAQTFPAGQGEAQRYPGPCRVVDIEEPRRQYENIDVYFRADVDGQKVSFVIEDKTGTQMHSDQLRRYREAISADGEPEDWLKLVYFKTGFMFDDERESARKAGYAVFSACDMLAVLDSETACSHDLVRMFRERLISILRERTDALAAWDMTKGYVQWRFMMRLRGRIDPARTALPTRGQGNGGNAWTQYPRWTPGRALFWRLDPGGQIRLMVNPAGVAEPWDWESWSAQFGEYARELHFQTHAFRRRRAWRGRTVSEGTVGAISLGGLELDPDGFLDRLGCLDRRFVAAIGRTAEEEQARTAAG